MISQLKAPVLGLIRLFKSLKMKKREKKKFNLEIETHTWVAVEVTAAKKDQHKV